MCVTLVGGMDRLQAEYMEAARQIGHSLKCIARNEKNFADKIGNPDRLIVFTNKISHEARQKVMRVARRKNIPVFLLHSCGISTLRNCLDERKA